jgi:flagellar hook-associated protein 1 FlgK
MSNLLASLRASSGALEALQAALGVSQNNVSNASTPGYARQEIGMKAREFAPQDGLVGGVTASDLKSTRDEFAEAVVRKQTSAFGRSQQDVSSLKQIESVFSLVDSGGVASSLDRLFSSFSGWSVNPNSVAAKENVLSAAGEVGRSFQKAAVQIESAAAEADQQVRSTVNQINHLASFVKQYNIDARGRLGNDAGLEAQLHQNLEQLSSLVDVQALKQEDGTITLLLGGQVGLVVGDSQYELSADFGYRGATPAVNAGALPKAYVLDSSGNDVSANIKSGELQSLLQFKNETVAQYLGDATSQGQLNVLAQAAADRINQIVSQGQPPPPTILFSYGASPVAVAHTLTLNPAMTAAILTAEEAGPPASANGKALALAGLANPTSAADKIDGLSYVSFFGQMGTNLGHQISTAKSTESSNQQLLTQARGLRDNISGVSLDEEAVRLLQYQRAYQASARIVSILDELTEIAVRIGA